MSQSILYCNILNVGEDRSPPDWHLTILGEGDARTELEALRSELELTQRVHLPGAVTNVNDYLGQSEIFLLSSRFEGFPMGLCEAMACGVPVIATDCLSGPTTWNLNCQNLLSIGTLIPSTYLVDCNN